MFWNRKQTTVEAPATPAAPSEAPAEPAPEVRSWDTWSSDDVQAAILELNQELARLDVERAALRAQSSDAMLAGQTALVADLEARRGALHVREETIRDTIGKAEALRTTAEKRERDDRLDADEREYRETVANQLEAQAVVREAEYALTRAVWARDEVVAGGRRDTLYHRLIGARRVVDAFPDLLERAATPDGYRALAAEQRSRAEALPLVDRATLPKTERDKIVAEIIAGQPERDRQGRLTDIAIDTQKARAAETYATFDRKPADAARHAGRVKDLERQRAELTGAPVPAGAPGAAAPTSDLDRRIAAVRRRLERFKTDDPDREHWDTMLSDLEQQRAALAAPAETVEVTA